MDNVRKRFSWSWYKEQMSGWTKLSYILLWVGYAIQIILGFSKGINGLSITSTIAGIIGFTCTVAITNQKSINGILGFVSAILLIYVAKVTGNYSDIIMQTAYIVLLDVPIMFNKQWGQGFDSRVMELKDVLTTIATFLVIWGITYALDQQLQSPQIVLDSLAATIGLTGAILTVRRFRASYYFWTAQGLMSVALWIQTAMHGHAVWVLMVTYMLYLANDLLAFCQSKWFGKSKERE